LRLAQTSSNGEQSDASAEKENGAQPQRMEPVRLEEVIVTAQKREEREQDVPESITVLNPNSLALNGQNSLLDYFASVPGLSLDSNSFFGGTHYLTIRGISAGFNQNPTVATVIDDVPVASSVTGGAGSFTSPDLDPSDLARIEVLKGPQGTLYGADSLSGLIKYVTVDPSTTKFGGRIEATGSDIPGGGAGYAVRGALNVPVSDTFAVRVSAFDRHDPGYIDDLTTGDKSFNSSNTYGGRASALWHPSDEISVKVSAIVQQTEGNVGVVDTNASGQPVRGDLNVTALPGTTRYDTQAQLYSSTLDWKPGGFDVVSVTGYVVNRLKTGSDQTGVLGQYGYACEQDPQQTSNNCNQGAFPANEPYVGVPYIWNATVHKVSEELRVSSKVGNWLDWRFGSFYTHEGGPFTNDLETANPGTGALTGTLFSSKATNTFWEYAVFGDATAHITDQFDLGFGERESWNKQTKQYVDSGIGVFLFDGFPGPYHGPVYSANGHAFTYQVTPRYKLSPDLMTYARIATGYRIGGYNSGASLAAAAGYNVPFTFEPDRTTNYEVGVKYGLPERKLSIDAALYYIAWKNFQLPVAVDNGFFGFTTNAGNAKSEGLEVSIEAQLWKGFSITFGGTYSDAFLTDGLPTIAQQYGPAGTPLPYSMRLSGGLTLNQEMPLTDHWIGFFGGGVNYVGSRPGEFIAYPPSDANLRIEFPPYAQINLHAGIRYDSILMNLYVNNAANRRGIGGITQSMSLTSTVPAGNPGGFDTTYIQPRTVGVTVSHVF
jgi:iron complex outermembrane receptor protein